MSMRNESQNSSIEVTIVKKADILMLFFKTNTNTKKIKIPDFRFYGLCSAVSL